MTHEESEKLKKIYKQMKRRCYDPKFKSYKYYGERGIKVCDDWKSDFNNFKKWSELKGFKIGLQIDRIDNDKGYEPNNCNFVTPEENVYTGKRRKYSNNSTGFNGVSYQKKSKSYMVSIRIDKKSKHLGRFKNINDALNCRINAEIKYLGKQLTNLKKGE